jgi:hypothetical protein
LLHPPGGSPGHAVARVRSAGATFFCLGDLFNSAAEVAQLEWLIAGRDPVTLPQSRRRFVDEAVASSALVVFSHPFASDCFVIMEHFTPVGDPLLHRLPF